MMLPTVEADSTAPPTSKALPWRGLRTAALVLAGMVFFFGVVLLAYELVVTRVPQHRATLERLVRAQTGLDVRFDELGLRWGWYGPEAVFRHVELGEPGSAAVFLRAPELVVGFDVWQTLRSGQLEAGRITLFAADIDLGRAGGARMPDGAHGPGGVRMRGLGGSSAASTAAGIRILEGWEGGRIDLKGGTLRLPDPAGSTNLLTLQIRQASLRRATSEWSGYGLVFLPERLGRTARLVIRLEGDLEHPTGLTGTVRFEGRRLVFSGWRELFGALPDTQRYLPRAGRGDLALDLDFARGSIVKANGRVSAGGLELGATDEPARAALDHVRGEWRLARRDSGWRLQIDSLELGDTANRAAPTTLNLDAASSGAWVRGTLEQAPLQSVAVIARWLAPQLDLSGLELGGTVRNVMFDWNRARPVGQRLNTTAQLVDVTIAPPSVGFTLTGLVGQISGDETTLITDLQARTARLELAQAPQYPLDGVRVATRLQIDRTANAWRITTGKLELQHEATRLEAQGSLTGDDSGRAPEINAHAELTGADAALLERLAGTSMAQAFGVTFSQLTQGRIERAQLELRGPLDDTLLSTGFTGALLLRDATFSGGDLWPDAREVDARIDWRGSRIHATIEKGRAGLAVVGMPSIDGIRGTLVFDAGYLRRSILTGAWLGGPVTLNVGERREQGALVLTIAGRGVVDARQLALAATAGTVIDETMAPVGSAQWSGELAYLAGTDSRPAQWRVRADSSLIGIASHLPEPLAKVSSAAVPLRVEAQGTVAAAQLHLSLGDRLRSLLSLQRREDGAWQVERGNVQFGASPAVLPAAPVLLVQGRVNRLDLPAYIVAWQQVRSEPAVPAIHAELVAREMLAAGRSYSNVKVLAQRADAGAALQLQSPDISGEAYWPVATNAGHPARFHFARLNVPDGAAFGASAELVAALGPATEFSVDDIVWEGRSLGSVAATIESGGDRLDVSDLRLSDSTQNVSGAVHCQSTTCRLKFNLDSVNAAATLEDFGFRPDLTAAKATLDGDLQWRASTDQSPLATLAGHLNMRLEDGMTRAHPDPNPQGPPFALFMVPALVSGLGQVQSASLPVSAEPHALRFSLLEADFEVGAGQASTANLYFDGDAEILMRGRTGLLAHDYDQQVWILRGEERLPEAVRRLGATPRVAAAWLSLRELFASGSRTDASHAPLHLQGSWDAPIVVAE